MTDQASSVNSTLGSNNLSTSIGLTGVPLAGALLATMGRARKNEDLVGALPDRSLAQRLAMEREASNKEMMPPSPQDLNQVLGESQAINELHLGLSTAASADTNASQKMGAFMATASMPWASSESVLKPQYHSAVTARNPFVEAVRGNPVAKIAALAFIPTTPFALWTLMGGQTSADKALAVVSLAQNEFVIEGIQDGSINDFSTRVNSGMDFLNGMKLESIKAESDPSLRFAGLLLEKVMKSEENPNILQEKVTEHHIIGARELLNELKAFLTKNPENIISGVKQDGGPFALKAMVQAVTGVPALLEAKYHAGPQVDSLMKTIGIDGKQAEKHLETLNGVGGFFGKLLGLQVEKAGAVLEKARESSETISKQAARQIMTGLAETVNDPKTRQGIYDANHNLANLGTQLLQAISGKADEQFKSNLASVNKAMAAVARAKNAHLN
jgi:uncharacterized protein YjgD (DUF1641 family)